MVAAAHRDRRKVAWSSDVIPAPAFIGRRASAAGIDMQNEQLVHANYVFADQHRKFVPEQALGRSPIVFTQPRRAVTKVDQHDMLMPVAGTKRGVHARHNGVFAGEVIDHRLLHSGDQKWELNRLAIHCLEPVIGYFDMVGVDGVVTEPLRSQRAAYWANYRTRH